MTDNIKNVRLKDPVTGAVLHPETGIVVPTVNDAKITIKKNGTKVDDFTLNQSSAKDINITVPTQPSDIGAAASDHTHSDYAASSHSHVGTEVTLTGYAKAASASAVAATDTVNAAIGKLEKAIDGKQASGSYAAASHTHTKSEITDFPTIPTVNNKTITIQKNGTTVDTFTLNQSSNKTINITVPTQASDINAAAATHSHVGTDTVLTGYEKASSASAVAATDTVNAAIGKLEKAIDGKQASGSYAAATHSHVGSEVTLTGYTKASSAADVAATDTVNQAIGKLQKTLDGKQAAGSYAAANHSHTAADVGAAAATHTHVKADITDFPTIPTVTDTYSGTSSDAMSGKAVKSAIDSAVASVYKPAGSVAFASRPTPGSSYKGNVYNITDSFTTDSTFVEGSGKTYPAGTNIVCINTTGSTYKWDVLSGIVDLSGYQQTDTAVTHTASTKVGDTDKPVYIAADGSATAISYTIKKSVPADAVFTDTTYSAFVGSGSSAAAGLVPKPSTTAGTSKYLREDGSWETPPDTKYTHPTTSGNKHIPSGGSSGQILKYSADGTATWANEYSYTHPTSAGNKHVPTGGSSNQVLVYGGSSGTASWGAVPAHTHSDYAASSHSHVGTEVTLTGYEKASSASAVAATDSVNAAIGKIEKALDGKQASGSYAAASHSHTKSEITDFPSIPSQPSDIGAAAATHSHVGTAVKLTGYSKASSVSAVAATDTVNAAIGKLEKAIDGKQASGSYAAADHTHSGYAASSHTHVGSEVTLTGYTKASSAADVAATDTVNQAIGKLQKTLDGKQAAGSYAAADHTHSGYATSNHTHSAFVGSGSTAAAGFVPKPSTTAGTSKYLCEDGTWSTPPDTDTVYTHPTTSGNKHIPSGGSSGQILKWSADGTATWAAEYSYTHPTTAGNKHIPSGGSSNQVLVYSSSGTAAWGAVPSHTHSGYQSTDTAVTHTASTAVGDTTTPVYIDADGVATALNYTIAKSVPADAVFTDTVYTHPTTAGNKHIPSGGSSNQVLVYSASGTAAWGSVPSHTHSGYAASSHTHTKSEITDFPTIPTITDTYSGTSSNGMSGKAVKSAIDSAIASVYKPAGSVAFASRPTPGSSYSGNVYNITDSFTTDSTFVEGAGNTYPAGTNIVCINTTGTTYKWDVLAGFVDLSGYQPTSTAVTHTASTKVGDTDKPVYIASNGAATAISYTIKKSVPADAVFTDTTYSAFVGSGSSAAAGLVPKPSTTAGTSKYLCEDGSWATPPDTTYTHPTTSGNKHIPSGGSSGKILKWSADGTATWETEYSYTHPTTAGNKHIPTGGSANQVLVYSSSGTAAWGAIPTHSHSGYQSTDTAVTHTASTAVGDANTPVYIASDGTATALSYTIAKSVPSDAVFTDTVYTHPTTAGNKHIPSGGSSNQVLVYSASGTAAWGAVPTHTHSGYAASDHTHSDYQAKTTAVTHTASTAAGSATQPVYVASDGTATACTYTLAKSVPSDAVFTDTVYTHPTTAGNKHIPTGGSANQVLVYSASGTAAWGAVPSHTHSGYSTTDTKNTAGSTNTSSKIFLVGATSQAANPQTYSHDTAFVDTDGMINSTTPATSLDPTATANKTKTVTVEFVCGMIDTLCTQLDTQTTAWS